MNEPTLSLAMRPQIGAVVRSHDHDITGEVVSVRAAARAGFWWMAVRALQAIDGHRQLLQNVYSGSASYVEAGGILRPISQPTEPEPRLGAKVLIRDQRITGQLVKVEPFQSGRNFDAPPLWWLDIVAPDGERWERVLSSRVDYIDQDGRLIAPVTEKRGAA
jgi:hypothetical protein